MKKHVGKLIYFAISLLWYLYIFNLGGGEAVIFPTLLTIIITAPIGLLFGALGSIVHFGEFYIPILLVLNYFQWIYFIKLFRKFKERRKLQKTS